MVTHLQIPLVGEGHELIGEIVGVTGGLSLPVGASEHVAHFIEGQSMPTRRRRIQGKGVEVTLGRRDGLTVR